MLQSHTPPHNKAQEHRRPFAILLGFFALAPSLAPAQSPAILHQVDTHYNHLATLRARYTEHYTGMGQDRTETGTLLLKKPGRMAWHYDQPTGKLFLLDGRSAIFYTPGDLQAQRLPAKKLDDLRTPLRFLLGHTELAKELEQITITPSGPNPNPDLRITGIPRGQHQRIQSLTLQVTPQGLITSMSLQEQDGARTDFTFTDIKENVPTTTQDFLFTPPPGVTIVDAPAPI